MPRRPTLADRSPPVAVPPGVRDPTNYLPTLVLWVVPLLLVLAYVVLVDQFFHDEARWTSGRVVGLAVLLIGVTAGLSVFWYAVAYGAALLLGEVGAVGVLGLVSRLPGIHRHVVVTPPVRPDTAREVWGRFGFLLLVALGFELILMIVVVHRGALDPSLAVSHPVLFFLDEALAGLLLAVLLAPVAPFLGSRLRTRITDSLEFPLLWLAVLLLIVGGASVLEYVVLPGVVIDPALFFTSVLLYAPAAWYISLAFSRTEVEAQRRFLRRAWAARAPRFHFGRLRVTDEPEGTITEV